MIQLNCNYYYDDLVEDVKNLTNRYQEILQSEVLGYSHDGRKIFLLKFGKGHKNIICTGGVHGRETTNPIVLMKMIETYCELYYGNQKSQQNEYNWKNIFDQYTIYFIPLLNPDGYMIALRGFNVIQNETLRLAAKSLNISYETWKYNARGIDLNRNFPSVYWLAKNQYDNPASENETKILINLFDQITSIGYIDYHSRGKMIYYYRNQMTDAYNETQIEIAKNLEKMTGYQLMDASDEIELGDSGGNTVHYYCEKHLMPAISIETTPEEAEFPLDIGLQGQTFQEIWCSPMALLKD